MKAPTRLRAALPGVLLLAFLVVLGGCADEESAYAAAGRYELDRADYARKLAAEHLEKADGTERTDVDAATRDAILRASAERARAIRLYLELRADGAFMARYVDAGGEQRLGGTWSQTGAAVTFRTTQIPGGRVDSIPDVTATSTADGLAFGGGKSGFVVPHAFVMRKVD